MSGPLCTTGRPGVLALLAALEEGRMMTEKEARLAAVTTPPAVYSAWPTPPARPRLVVIGACTHQGAAWDGHTGVCLTCGAVAGHVGALLSPGARASAPVPDHERPAYSHRRGRA